MRPERRRSAAGRLYCALPLVVLMAAITSEATAAAAGRAAVPSRAERISMDVWRRPLREVATELARVEAVDILMPASLEDLEVSASLVDLDVRGALQRLLAHHSYMLVERREERSGGRGQRVIEIVVMGAAQSAVKATAAPVRVTAHEERSVDELVREALAATSAGERAAAVDAIAYRDPTADGPESRAEAVLLSALGDPVDEVRAQAISTLKDTADEIPFDALSQVAREDEHAAIRIQALELLVERGEERALAPLRIALLDSEDAVRTRARELIDEWHLDAGRADSP